MATRPETPRAATESQMRRQDAEAQTRVGVDGWPDGKKAQERIQQAVDRAHPGWTIRVRVESKTRTRIVLIIDARNLSKPQALPSAAVAEQIGEQIKRALQQLLPGAQVTVQLTVLEPGHLRYRANIDLPKEGDPPVSADGALLFDSSKPTLSDVTVVRLNQGEKPYGRWLFVHFLDDHVPKSQINTRPGLLQLATVASTSPSQPGSTITVISYPWPNAPSTANITSMGPNNTPVTQQLALATGQTYAIWLPLSPQYAYLNQSGLGRCKIWW